MSEIRMKDISDKEITLRIAQAEATIKAKKHTLALIKEGKIPKGDVLATAQIAGIQAAKNTSSIIPLCHPLKITSAQIDFKLSPDKITVTSTVKTYDRSGVEMEALCSVAAAALSIYDMCKPVDKEMTINEIKLLFKSGGKSGVFQRR